MGRAYWRIVTSSERRYFATIFKTILFLRGRGAAMPRSRWRLVAAGASVVVGAATGVITNLITTKSNIALAVGLGALLVIGVALQVALAAGDGSGEAGDGAVKHPRPSVRQNARAHGHGTIIQAGGDVVLRPGDGVSSSGDGKVPTE